MKVLLKGGRVVDPMNGRDGVFDVLVDGDRIARIGHDLRAEDGTTVVSRSTGRSRPTRTMRSASIRMSNAPSRLFIGSTTRPPFRSRFIR